MRAKRKVKQVKKDIKEVYLTFRCTKKFKKKVHKIAKKYKLKISEVLEDFVNNGILEFEKKNK
jgi:hypothetical protein